MAEEKRKKENQQLFLEHAPTVARENQCLFLFDGFIQLE